MNKTIFILSFILLLNCQNRTEEYDLVVHHISIIDTKNLKIIPDQTIFIKEGRIDKITDREHIPIFEADTIMNGTGKFIIPGFWDMHVHIAWKESLAEQLFPTFLNYGVTGIRDMGGDADILKIFKEKVKESPHSSPILFGSGPILDGKKPIHPAFSVSATPSNVRVVLDSLYHRNVDFFKVYSLLSDEVLDSISVYSQEKNIPFSGHISEYITPEKASQLGQKSFEHLNRLEILANDSERISAFARLAQSNGNWFSPTLLIYQRKYEFENGEFFYHPLFEELDSDLKFEWDQVKTATANSPKTEADLTLLEKKLESQKRLIKSFYDNGIPFLLGTDFSGMQFIYPGYSLHEEMALMHSIGIPTFDILQMATYNPTLFLGIQDIYGSIEVGKAADFVILNSNPVENIEHTLSIDNVIRAGKIF